MEWVKEHQDWEKTKQERAPKALTVCQQAKYDQWLAHPQRDLLLDLSRCCRTNKGGKNVALISLRLSMLPQELQMRCDATWKPLFVRQYMSAEEHPVVQDLPLGIQQPAPAHLLQPGLDSAPEPDGEDMEASEQGECEAGEGAAVPRASHGSGDYKHLLPKREGAPWSSSAHVMCVLCVFAFCLQRHKCAGVRIQRLAVPGTATKFQVWYPPNPGELYETRPF